MRVGFVFGGFEGCAVLDPAKQSLYRGGVGIDPAVTLSPLDGCPLGSEGFLSRFSGLGLVPPERSARARATRPAPSLFATRSIRAFKFCNRAYRIV